MSSNSRVNHHRSHAGTLDTAEFLHGSNDELRGFLGVVDAVIVMKADAQAAFCFEITESHRFLDM